MTDELMKLREEVNNVRKFLGPNSRTGNNLEDAMRRLEQTAQLHLAPAGADAPCTDEHGDDAVLVKGPWTYRADPKAPTHVGRYFVESDDFSHDVRLYINGDFGSDADRRAYGEALAETLNRAGPLRADLRQPR